MAKKIFLFICFLILTMFFAVLIFFVATKNKGAKSKDELVNEYVDGIKNENGLKIYKRYSDEYVNFRKNEDGYSRLALMKECKNQIKDCFENVKEQTGKIDSIEMIDITWDEAGSNDIGFMKSYMESEFGINIEDYSEAHILWNVSGESGKIQMETYLYTYKLKGSWYILDWD